MNFLFRTDASVSIGTGHVMRCLALAQAVQDAGGHAIFAFQELPEALVERLKFERVEVIRITEEAGTQDDGRTTAACAERFLASWVVVDGDRFTSDCLSVLQRAGLRVALYDDFADRKSFPVDVVVNPNLGATDHVYERSGFTGSLLLGESYVPLRREFLVNPEERVFPREGNKILVTLGGSDPENLTPQIAAALAKVPDWEITIVAGPGYERATELRELVDRDLKIVSNPADMRSLMEASDLAVIAAGGTLWELLYLGCAVLSYARNLVQARVVGALAEKGAVVDMGDTKSLDGARLLAVAQQVVASRQVRENMAVAGRAVIDGRGAERVVATLLKSRRQG